MPILPRVLAAMAVLLSTCAAHALDIQPYSADALAAAQAAGKPVAVQFHADWCPTCRKQEKAFKALQSDPDLKELTLLVADYDMDVELKRAMNVRTQSTVIVFKGKQEVARVGGVTDSAGLKATLAKGL